MEEEDPLNIEIADSMYALAGRLALNVHMTDERAARLLASLPEGDFLLKFLQERAEGDWVLEEKFDPLSLEREKGQASLRSHGRRGPDY